MLLFDVNCVDISGWGGGAFVNVPSMQFDGCCIEGGVAVLPLSFFDCFRISVLLKGNALFSGIGSSGNIDRCVEGNVALPLNLFVSCHNSCRTLVDVSFLLDCNGLSPLFFLRCLQRWHHWPTLDAVWQCWHAVDFVLQPPWVCGPTFCWCVVEFLLVFALDDVVVEKTSVVSSSTFCINQNQYYILTYLGFNCLHTLELLLISDVLEDGPNFFWCQQIIFTQKGINICMRFCCLLNLYWFEKVLLCCFFISFLFLYQKKHIFPNLNQINQPTMAKKTKKKTPPEASTPKKCKPSPLIVMPTKKIKKGK